MNNLVKLPNGKFINPNNIVSVSHKWENYNEEFLTFAYFESGQKTLIPNEYDALEMLNREGNILLVNSRDNGQEFIMFNPSKIDTLEVRLPDECDYFKDDYKVSLSDSYLSFDKNSEFAESNIKQLKKIGVL